MNTYEESREFIAYANDGVSLTDAAKKAWKAPDRVKAALIGYHLWAEQRGFGSLDLTPRDICMATGLSAAQVKSPLVRLRRAGFATGDFGKHRAVPHLVAIETWRLRRKLKNPILSTESATA